MTSNNLPDELKNYYRGSEDNVPTIQGTKVRMDPRCKVCSIVPTLQKEYGYTVEESHLVEEHVYHMIMNFWEATEVSRWLKDKHELEISHDSVSRHIKRHMPDPRVAFLERVKSYRPGYQNPRFMQNVVDTMRYVMLQFREDLVEGRIEIKPMDFLRIAEVYKEWQDDALEDPSDQLMVAMIGALEEAELSEEQIDTFKRAFRSKLQEQEEQHGE